jgi:nitroreductase
MTRIPQLDEAVEHALRAPSVHNTQPWRWRIDTADGVVELYADRGRRLSASRHMTYARPSLRRSPRPPNVSGGRPAEPRSYGSGLATARAVASSQAPRPGSTRCPKTTRTKTPPSSSS